MWRRLKARWRWWRWQRLPWVRVQQHDDWEAPHVRDVVAVGGGRLYLSHVEQVLAVRRRANLLIDLGYGEVDRYREASQIVPRPLSTRVPA